MLGAVGVARWRGVRLSTVLERAGLTRAAVGPGSRVLVIGDGTIALLAVYLLQLWSPAEVVLLGRREAIDEPDLQGLGGIDHARGHHELLGATEPDEGWQSRAAAANVLRRQVGRIRCPFAVPMKRCHTDRGRRSVASRRTS